MDDKHTCLLDHFAKFGLDHRAMMPPRIDISRQDIAKVVAEFYGRVRAHDVLGPIFAAHVDDWPAHEEKITRFWANAILFERSYDGNPMHVHLQAQDVLPAHFEPWLALFDKTLAELIASPQREQWSNLAHRIGRGLSFGVTDARCPVGSIPNLRNG